MSITMAQLFCRHVKSKSIAVSGIGYSEYEICFCQKCDRPFINQVRMRDGWFHGRKFATAEPKMENR